VRNPGIPPATRAALWSPSYFAISVGGAPLEILKEYIKNQEKPSFMTGLVSHYSRSRVKKKTINQGFEVFFVMTNMAGISRFFGCHCFGRDDAIPLFSQLLNLFILAFDKT
jgi:Transposase IS200 like